MVELVRRDLVVRYKRSVLGIAWTMLSPLLNMIALAFVFSTVLKGGIPYYAVYLLCGLLFWSFFSQTTGHAASLTLEAAETTKKVYVPRSVFVAEAVGVGTVNVVLGLVPLALIVLFSGHPFRWTWLFLPVSLVIGMVFSAGVGLFVFTLASRFIDVKETYLVLLQVVFFLTPIVYDSSMVPGRFRWIVRLNPMTYLVEVFRAPLYNGWLPGYKTLTFSILAAVGSLVVGWLFYASRIDAYGARS